MAYDILFTDLAIEEFRTIRVFDRRKIGAQIDKQLKHRPTVETRKRKCLGSVVADFKHEPPIWELRVGAYRVFYDVNEEEQSVTVRAVREKGRRTTGEIIHEKGDS